MRRFLLTNDDIVVVCTYEEFGETITNNLDNIVVPTTKDVLDCDFNCRMTIYERVPNVTIIKEL